MLQYREKLEVVIENDGAHVESVVTADALEYLFHLSNKRTLPERKDTACGINAHSQGNILSRCIENWKGSVENEGGL